MTIAGFVIVSVVSVKPEREVRRKTNVALNFRQTEILELARAEGRVVVEDLAQRFDVTLQTIRRDLSDLADAGHLDRVHGGAVLRTGVANIGYEARRRMNEGAKAAIARACAAAIPDNCSLILNLGTTTEAVARELLAHRNITVITNNMNVANILVANPGCEIVVAGGALRRTDGTLLDRRRARGDLHALRAWRSFRRTGGAGPRRAFACRRRAKRSHGADHSRCCVSPALRPGPCPALADRPGPCRPHPHPDRPQPGTDHLQRIWPR